jgi:hypothetical protein
MNPVPNTPSKSTAPDPDLVEQARPGHGIPSQDPDSAAQSPLEPAESARESNSVLAGGGVIVGVAAGAAIGSMVAGPVGAVVGGTVGAVAGALGGAVAGPLVSPGPASATPASVPAPAKPASAH